MKLRAHRQALVSVVRDVDDPLGIVARSRKAFPIPVVNGETVKRLDEVERDYILAILELSGGNQRRTAKQLGIGPATLYRKLKKWGMIRQPRDRSKKS